MKKIFAFVLLILVIVSGVLIITSCTDSKIERAVERTSELDSYDATLTMTISAGESSKSFQVEMEIKDKEDGHEKEKYELNADGVETEIYRDGGWLYFPATKTKISLRDYTTAQGVDFSIYKEIVEGVVEELPDGLIASADVKEIDGEYIISAKLTSGEIADDYEDAITAIKAYYNMKDATVEGAKIDVVVDGRYVDTYTLTINLKHLGTDYTIVASVEYSDPGERIKIEFPKGYEDYKASDLGNEVQ